MAAQQGKKHRFLIRVGICMLSALLLLTFLPVCAQAAGNKKISSKAVELVRSKAYTGKNVKPSVTVKKGKKTLKKGRDYTVQYKNNKKIGTATVIIKGKGKYTGSVKKTFRIVPKKVKLLSVSATVSCMTVKWKKHPKQTSGFQVEIGESAKFKNKRKQLVRGKNKVKTIITGLRGDTTYYVRVRAYKTVNGKKYYSAWSKTKTATTFADENDPYRKYPEVSETERAMAKNNAEIALQILRERTAEKSGTNSLVSPLSLYEDLTMAAGAAGGTTLSELEAYLGGTVPELSDAIAAYNRKLPGSLHIANSIWINKAFGAPGQDFRDHAVKNFRAEVKAVPYNGQTVNEINSWVKKNTNGMIPTLVEQLYPDEVMHLINAVAFESQWRNPYEKEDIKEAAKFTNSAGKKETCVMLSSKEARYLKLENEEGKLIAQGFLKPYADGRTAFLGLLPEKGKTPQDVLNELDGERYMAMYRGNKIYSEGALHAGIPEFSLDDKLELDVFMKKAGVEEAFTEDADFSKMLEAPMDIHIDSVLQKTHIEVDRSGTKAAAATDITVKASSAPSKKDLYLTLNRPFVYALVDYRSGLPLFMGVQNKLK